MVGGGGGGDRSSAVKRERKETFLMRSGKIKEESGKAITRPVAQKMDGSHVRVTRWPEMVVFFFSVRILLGTRNWR